MNGESDLVFGTGVFGSRILTFFDFVRFSRVFQNEPEGYARPRKTQTYHFA
jgi:hypothetical protein